ncbi:MAG TPA: hypothetical protein DCP57_04660, partial [Gammaproteobacteria bacterium]|nr:hypothetical protein [Gammaproteobacteria bacterium]
MPKPAPSRSLPVREMFLVMVATAAVFLLLAILSYSPRDPSFNYTGSNLEVQNWVGSSGAFLADLLLFLVGFSAYLLPAALIYLGLRTFLDRKSPPPVLVAMRASGC